MPQPVSLRTSQAVCLFGVDLRVRVWAQTLGGAEASAAQPPPNTTDYAHTAQDRAPNACAGGSGQLPTDEEVLGAMLTVWVYGRARRVLSSKKKLGPHKSGLSAPVRRRQRTQVECDKMHSPPLHT